jgi:hypothetical protein
LLILKKQLVIYLGFRAIYKLFKENIAFNSASFFCFLKNLFLFIVIDVYFLQQKNDGIENRLLIGK